MKNVDLTKDSKLEKWEDIKPYFDDLLSHEFKSVDDTKDFIKNTGILSAFIEEKIAWAYINMTCHTDNEEYVKRFQFLTGEIGPKIEEAFFKLDKKLYDSKFFGKLSGEYGEYKKSVKTSIELYRENNLALKAEENVISSQYDQIAGSIMVEYKGEEYTLNQISKLMETDNRPKREQLWKISMDKKREYKHDLTAVFDRLFSLRNVIAKNADFENYRDYMFKAKERFDYTPEDCFKFHASVEKHVVPLIRKIQEKHKERLGLDDYRPWDITGLKTGEKPLMPFKDGEELLDKTIKIYKRIRPELGKNLEIMRKNSLFDLDSRKGKAPGGYNYPLMLTNMPFIFMNSVGSQRDVITLMHEGGHAMHSFQTKDMEIMMYKNTPSESAELASMAMELITMDYWDEFYDNETDLNRAKREQLERSIKIFPWVMIVDAFQHWMYENHEHTFRERQAKFAEILDRFDAGIINWKGFEDHKSLGWIFQLHITTVPFYYIEYAIAQLGALQVWRNYKTLPDIAVNDYLAALSLGSSKPLPEVYKQAGIKFDFSEDMIAELMDFVNQEYDKIT